MTHKLNEVPGRIKLPCPSLKFQGSCSIPLQQQRQESQMNEVQTGLERAFGILPKPPAISPAGQRIVTFTACTGCVLDDLRFNDAETRLGIELLAAVF
jgi:hypothetical protein